MPWLAPCPHCGKNIKIPKHPKSYGRIHCAECRRDGIGLGFRAYKDDQALPGQSEWVNRDGIPFIPILEEPEKKTHSDITLDELRGDLPYLTYIKKGKPPVTMTLAELIKAKQIKELECNGCGLPNPVSNFKRCRNCRKNVCEWCLIQGGMPGMRFCFYRRGLFMKYWVLSLYSILIVCFILVEMPKQHKQRARKDYPAQGIKKGDIYYRAKSRFGPMMRQLTPFKQSQLTQSPFLSGWLEQQEALEERRDTFNGDDVREAASHERP